MISNEELDRIETRAEEFRLEMGIPDDIVPDMVDLLHRMAYAKNVHFEVIRDTSLGKSAALFDPLSNTIKLSASTAEKPLPRNRFTIAHEIGHFLADHAHVRHRKADSSRQFGKAVVPDEAVANAFAAALLIPERLAKVDQDTTVEQLATRFAVSRPMAELRLATLQRRYRLRHGLRRELPTSHPISAARPAPVRPDVIDTGNYEDAMPEMLRNASRWNK